MYRAIRALFSITDITLPRSFAHFVRSRRCGERYLLRHKAKTESERELRRCPNSIGLALLSILTDIRRVLVLKSDVSNTDRT